MKKFLIIFQKEFKDIIRDKRTLIAMVVIPILVFPLMLKVTSSITEHQMENEKNKHLMVGVIGKEYGQELFHLLSDRKDIQFKIYDTVKQTDTLIKSGTLDGSLFIDRNFDSSISGFQTGNLTLYFKSENWGVKDRLMEVIGLYKSNLTKERMEHFNLKKESIDPIEVKIEDVSSKRELLGHTIGGIIPYIFVIFAFMGCIYPSIDLFTNEKEKGTLETILTAPVSRIEILFAKMSVVALVGFSSAILSIVGLSFGLKNFASELPPDIMQALSSFLQPINIIMLLALLLPLTVFFASLLTLITTYAKSYKEAQSTISPLTILVLMPAVIGIMPGIELNFKTALIPITNISLATKEVVSGTIHPVLYFLVLVSLLVYAGIGIIAARFWFTRESNIIKS